MDERLERGIRRLREVDSRQIGRLVAGLADVAPDFATHVIAFAFGDVHARPGLDLRTRQLAAVAALTALGNAGVQLRVQIEGALNVGCGREEIVETIMQTAIWAGFPAALSGFAAARDVFRGRDRPRDASP